MTPIAYGQGQRLTWSGLPVAVRGVTRLAAFVAAWGVLLAVITRA